MSRQLSTDMTLTLSEIIIIAFAAFATATLSGAIGMGGGITLLTILTSFFPVSVLIPIHGVVQLGSNVTRSLFNFRSINKTLALKFLLGAFTGALVASQVKLDIPEEPFKAGLGLFILVATWLPRPRKIPKYKYTFAFLGFFTTFISLFVGATGPVLAPFFLNRNLSRKAIVASKAACQTFIHVLKITVFSFWGFKFSEYLYIIIIMLIAVTLGAYTGKKLLNKISEKLFLWIFKILLSALSLRLIFTFIS